MTDECLQRYSLDEVMNSLRAIVCAVAGKEIQFENTTRIDRVLAQCVGVALEEASDYELEDMWDIYYFSLFSRIEQCFRLDVGRDDVDKWLLGDARSHVDWKERVAPQRTMEKLAAIIVLHSRKISFDPVTILGRYCAPAGAFRGMEDVAYSQIPDLKKFGPSTPIRDRLRGSELSQFWNRVRFCSGRRIPEIVDSTSSEHWTWKYANLVTLLLLPILVVESAFWVGIIPRGIVSDWVPPVAGVVLGLVLAIRARIRIGRVFAYFCNPLPSNIHSFRDLAELIVRHQPDEKVAA